MILLGALAVSHSLAKRNNSIFKETYFQTFYLQKLVFGGWHAKPMDTVSFLFKHQLLGKQRILLAPTLKNPVKIIIKKIN